MKILAIDTTGDTCSVAIGQDGNYICSQYLHDKNTHSVNLMPMIDRCLNMCDMTIDDIDAFAIAVGPGSFTGIRIGVCTVKGFATLSDKPCIAISTLDGLAQNAFAFSGTICPLIDARRSESYFAFYQSDGRSIKRISDYGADKLDVFLKDLPDGNVCFVGDGAINYKELIVSILGDRAFFLNDADMLQNATSILKIAFEKAKNEDFISSFDLMPYYHRVSQAERMKETKNES
jgi:tRNA threonylcarbamoyladenosine biosynthesis protein TsaB